MEIDTNALSRILYATRKFISDREAFTSLDVSEYIKNDGGGFLRHRDIKPYTRLILDFLTGIVDDFIFTDIQVITKDGIDFARLFHPRGFDVKRYVNNKRVASSPMNVSSSPRKYFDNNTQPSVQPSVKDGIPDPTTLKTQIHKIISSTDPQQTLKLEQIKLNYPGSKNIVISKVRSDGRILLPSVSLDAFDKTYIKFISHPNSISITESDDVDGVLSETGIRIPKGVVYETSIKSGNEIAIINFTDKILIAKI